MTQSHEQLLDTIKLHLCSDAANNRDRTHSLLCTICTHLGHAINDHKYDSNLAKQRLKTIEDLRARVKELGGKK